MKKFFLLLLALCACLCFSGCGGIKGAGSVSPRHTPTADATIDAYLTMINATALPRATSTPTERPAMAIEAPVGVDLDLTQLSGMVVYAQVLNMMSSPKDFVGQIVRMGGQFVVSHDALTSENYYAVVIADATACCAQGIEFVRSGSPVWPGDYPPNDTKVIVTGEFQTYEISGFTLFHLVNATLEY